MTKITKTMCLTQLAETDVDLYVCDNPQPRKCVGNCKKLYTPTNANISSRRPSCYWKQCGICRAYMHKRNEKCTQKNKN